MAGSFHELKCWPPGFDLIAAGKKNFDIRRDDRPYQVGDMVLMREYMPDVQSPAGGRFTGRNFFKRILWIGRSTEIPPDWGLAPGFCVLSFDSYAANVRTHVPRAEQMANIIEKGDTDG